MTDAALSARDEIHVGELLRHARGEAQIQIVGARSASALESLLHRELFADSPFDNDEHYCAKASALYECLLHIGDVPVGRNVDQLRVRLL